MSNYKFADVEYCHRLFLPQCSPWSKMMKKSAIIIELNFSTWIFFSELKVTCVNKQNKVIEFKLTESSMNMI